MTSKKKLSLLTAGPVGAGCLLFILDCGVLFLPLRIALIFSSLLNPLGTAFTARGLGGWLAFPATAVLRAIPGSFLEQYRSAPWFKGV
jgi:predicted PurR-regulated permease PerM